MKILILTIATNKYIQFVERLYDNIEDKFLNGHEIQGLLFTEHDVETSDNIKVSQIDHAPWPMPTLKRFNYFVEEIDKFLLDYNMTRVETDWAGDIWGDALYIKKQ